MYLLRILIVGFCMLLLLSACVAAEKKEKARVYCPACGHEFDALFQKRF